MIFRPIRTLLIIGVAFVAGVIYEKSNVRDACAEAGGRYDAPICVGASR